MSSVPANESLTLRTLEHVKPIYFLPRENVASEVLIPAFRVATRADCMVGFFSSKSLVTLAPGLAAYLNSSQHGLRLIISPFLSIEDRSILQRATDGGDNVAQQALSRLLVTQDMLERHTLECLAHLLRDGRLQLRVALMREGLFHPKAWLFSSDADCLAVHGSNNLTEAGLGKNFEQISVSKSWVDHTQSVVVTELSKEFERLWVGQDPACVTVSAPQAVRDNLLREFGAGARPTERDFEVLFTRARELGSAITPDGSSPPSVAARPTFSIPVGLNYQSGAYSHQGESVTAWCDARYRGVLEMATGAGKTISAMVCAHRLYERHQPLVVVIAAPYIPLIQQWTDEVAAFGIEPINLGLLGGQRLRNEAVRDADRRLRMGTTKCEVFIVSHDLLCSADFRTAVEKMSAPKLLIADEAHNLGRQEFVASPPEFFEYRLGLSATPVRQYDEPGTAALFKFFGDVVYRFTLEQAIGRCLVEYEYHVHPVYLAPTEMDDWYQLSAQIRSNAWRQSDAGPDAVLAKMLRDRRALLELTSSKLTALAKLLGSAAPHSFRHTLIYTSDKGPSQLRDVNRLLTKKQILFHQLTADETSDRALTRRVIEDFQSGAIQVLTAKRVLDEGVNIPQIQLAYVLASTTVERQWVQRRGRLLRICPSIGKTFSVIHDFLALPPISGRDLDHDAKALIESELRRVREFARLSKNAGRPDGPLNVINELNLALYT